LDDLIRQFPRGAGPDEVDEWRQERVQISINAPVYFGPTGDHTTLMQEVHMRDKIDVSNSGQIGAIGSNAKSAENIFSQNWSKIETEVDLEALAMELARLRGVLRSNATTVEEDQSVAHVGAAENAAKQNDGPTALRHLKSAGQWAFDVATKIGTAIAEKPLKTQC
jgi:hypothetical protein